LNWLIFRIPNEKIEWEEAEIIEIIELLAQVLKKFLILSPYHSMKKVVLNFNLKYDPKAFLKILNTIVDLKIIKSSSLFAISYLTIILQKDFPDIVCSSTSVLIQW
jgi:hypothetical protein